MRQEQQPQRENKIDLRVHACLFFIRPTGHTWVGSCISSKYAVKRTCIAWSLWISRLWSVSAHVSILFPLLPRPIPSPRAIWLYSKDAYVLQLNFIPLSLSIYSDPWGYSSPGYPYLPTAHWARWWSCCWTCSRSRWCHAVFHYWLYRGCPDPRWSYRQRSQVLVGCSWRYPPFVLANILI